jgi:hypothetical protein
MYGSPLSRRGEANAGCTTDLGKLRSAVLGALGLGHALVAVRKHAHSGAGHRLRARGILRQQRPVERGELLSCVLLLLGGPARGIGSSLLVHLWP